MRTWTDSAKAKLEEHLASIQRNARSSGADPAEVSEDIRRHIEEEVAARKLEVVTATDVETILNHLGLPETVAETREPSSKPIFTAPAPEPAKTKFHPFLLIFGVLLPVIAIAIELVTRMSAAIFVDPMPDRWHAAMVISVPVINVLSWWALLKNKQAWRRWLGFANGFALGILGYYSAMYAVLSPFACVAIIAYGLGLLPLAPLFGFISALRLRSLLKASGDAGNRQLPGLRIGLGVAVLTLLLTALPFVLTRHWSQTYVSGSPDEKKSAIKRLRTLGRERVLLSDCYSSSGREGAQVLGVYFQGKPVTANEARTIYYRVTGQPFNAKAPPQRDFGAARWNFLDEISWDAEAGGSVVGGRLKGLSLAQSRIDGLLNADAAWSYVEWTLEFKNVAAADREARAQIQLPPGGVVSRLTLWVNGEEREAAFASSGQVREAYQQVVKVQRRDPVLVTSSGPDRVMVQCFPVPPNGGTIKVRLGVTFPLHLENEATALLVWPRFIERNFSIAEHLEHALWLEAKQPLQANHPAFKSEQSKTNTYGLRGQLHNADLGTPSTTVRIKRDSSINATWVPDHQSKDGSFVRQVIAPKPGAAPSRAIIVLDGSAGMKEAQPQIAEALRQLSSGLDASVIVASDSIEELVPLRGVDAMFRTELENKLEHFHWAGGQDNLPALIKAWDMAAEKPGGVVVWIHGPQPLLLEDGEQIEQRLLWRFGDAAPVIHELQTTSGPDSLIQKFHGRTAMTSVARLGSVREDLERLLSQWNPHTSQLHAVRERFHSVAMTEASRGKESSKHLVRLWANDEVRRMIAANRRDDAVKLASKHQLVTPVSGAVVLETKQQFDQAGLQPVSPDSVPVVPEPGTLLLITVSLCLLVLVRTRSRASKRQDVGLVK